MLKIGRAALILVLFGATKSISAQASVLAVTKAAVDTTKKDTVSKPKPVPSVTDTMGHAFTKYPLTQAQYARAIERNDRKLLNADCEQITISVALRASHKITTCPELAGYIRSLVSAPCPQMTTRLGRIKRGIVDTVWSRPLRRGEICLYDSNDALWKFSLSCGNDILDTLPVRTAMAPTPAKPSVVVATESEPNDDAWKLEMQRKLDEVNERLANQPSAMPERSQPAPVPNHVETTGVVVVEGKPGWWHRNWPWAVPVTGAALVAGGCAIAAAFNHYCLSNVNNNYNDGRLPPNNDRRPVVSVNFVQILRGAGVLHR